MKRINVLAAVVWAAVGVGICGAATGLRLGSWRQPEPGLFPFLIGAGIVLLAAVEVVSQAVTAAGPAERVRVGQAGRLAIVLGLLGAYALALERIGFLACTFLFLVALFRTLGAKGWTHAVGAGALVTLVAYVFFESWLRVNLPRGPWGL